MKKAIITQRIYHYEPYNELWECLDSRLYEFLLSCGIVGFGVSYKQIQYIDRLFDNADMLVLSGGNDIGVYPLRDDFEYALITYALKHHKKIFAICRGMQILARYFDIALESSTHDIGKIHRLEGALRHEVHSYHRFCIKRAPQSCEILARIGDEIEVFSNKQILALMWHPERESDSVSIESDKALLKEFVEFDFSNKEG